MKKIVIFIQSICALFLLSACEDEFDGFVVNDTTPVVLSSLTITDIELDNVNGNNPAVTFNWTRANYGQQTVVNYAVQISSAANFAFNAADTPDAGVAVSEAAPPSAEDSANTWRKRSSAV